MKWDIDPCDAGAEMDINDADQIRSADEYQRNCTTVIFATIRISILLATADPKARTAVPIVVIPGNADKNYPLKARVFLRSLQEYTDLRALLSDSALEQ